MILSLSCTSLGVSDFLVRRTFLSPAVKRYCDYTHPTHSDICSFGYVFSVRLRNRRISGYVFSVRPRNRRSSQSAELIADRGLSVVNNLVTRTVLSYVRWLSVVVACITVEKARARTEDVRWCRCFRGACEP